MLPADKAPEEGGGSAGIVRQFAGRVHSAVSGGRLAEMPAASRRTFRDLSSCRQVSAVVRDRHKLASQSHYASRSGRVKKASPGTSVFKPNLSGLAGLSRWLSKFRWKPPSEAPYSLPTAQARREARRSCSGRGCRRPPASPSASMTRITSPSSPASGVCSVRGRRDGAPETGVPLVKLRCAEADGSRGLHLDLYGVETHLLVSPGDVNGRLELKATLTSVES